MTNMIKTIAKNRTKFIDAIFAKAVLCVHHDKSTDFEAIETKPEFMRGALARFSFAKLTQDSADVYRVRVHSNSWYMLYTSLDAVPAHLADMVTVAQESTTEETDNAIIADYETIIGVSFLDLESDAMALAEKLALVRSQQAKADDRVRELRANEPVRRQEIFDHLKDGGQIRQTTTDGTVHYWPGASFHSTEPRPKGIPAIADHLVYLEWAYRNTIELIPIPKIAVDITEVIASARQLNHEHTRAMRRATITAHLLLGGQIQRSKDSHFLYTEGFRAEDNAVMLENNEDAGTFRYILVPIGETAETKTEPFCLRNDPVQKRLFLRS